MKKLLLLITLFYLTGCEKAPPKMTPPHEVTVAQPAVCDVPVYLDYIGNLTPNISVQVMAQVSGILTEQYFVEGQEVKEGDLLLVIDPRPYEADLAKAEAMLKQTNATLNYAKDTTSRYQKLVEQDFVSQLNFDSYVTNVLTNQAVIDQNLADIALAEINLGYCYIRSTMNAVTGLLQVKPGNYVTANGATVLTVLNQIQPILVNFYVPETDLMKIQMREQKNNLKVEVFPESSHTKSYVGTLSLIDNQVNQGTGAILMQATLPNEEKLLWPGHFVDVRVHIGKANNALVVPTTAVLIGQTGHYVYVVGSDNTIAMKSVQIGQRHEEQTVIYSGVTGTDKVVVTGQLNLYPGMKVAIKGDQTPQPAATQKVKS